ncbi:replication-associated recombination protein A [Streptomyces europaeiscabiei]|nr:replication-associated recombination protein A [Streptomyces europaeiscabiei]MDX3837941.1 replication-associated recombination protein A [Streptomyces europaeiscabiei]
MVDLRKVFATARGRRGIGQGTLLFVDEIHRFNRAQQDSFLPYVEDGTATLIGATTENPSFELNGALLSRTQVLVLERLDEAALSTLLDRAEQLTGHHLPLDDDARRALIAMADGDGCYLLNMAEQLQALPDTETTLDTAGLAHHIQQRAPLYDKAQEGHYNLISALHKSMRGSDPDAALYWLARMLDGGEDPLFVARRLARFANEDIGMADPHAIQQALAAWDVYERLGSPEGELAIAQAVVYLATAPKSIAVYRGFNTAHRAARHTGSLMPPAHILNAPTRLMKDLGYGKDYQYDPDTADGFSGDDYIPDDMDRETYEARSGHTLQAVSAHPEWSLRADFRTGRFCRNAGRPRPVIRRPPPEPCRRLGRKSSHFHGPSACARDVFIPSVRAWGALRLLVSPLLTPRWHDLSMTEKTDLRVRRMRRRMPQPANCWRQGDEIHGEDRGRGGRQWPDWAAARRRAGAGGCRCGGAGQAA